MTLSAAMPMSRRRVLLLAALALCAACGREAPPAAGPRYGDAPAAEAPPLLRFAIHPLHNPAKLHAVYQPLVDDLNRELGGRVRLQLEASLDYGDFERKYRAREPALLLPNPWQTLDAAGAGYHVVGVTGEDADFRGVILVRRDGGIHVPADLRGRVVSYPAPTALAACVMPQFFLHRHGVALGEVTNHYVGSQESSIMHVVLGTAAAGATWPPPWRQFQRDHPHEAATLRIAWETEALIGNSVMVRDDLPPEVVQALVARLVALDGMLLPAAGEAFRFRRAGDADYAPVRDFVATFEREVRPVARAEP